MDRVSTLLAQFPGPVRLAVSRLKWLAYMAVAAGFTVGAIDMIIEPGSRHVITGWFGAIIFSLSTVAAAVMIVPGASEMALDGGGLNPAYDLPRPALDMGGRERLCRRQ